ncbi:hypothetical protein [Seonamhaeicola maritimus]|uniref:hypothetical protein n=1 Tax=Seonamhaeicola maritimus TaxID=2591822 RepID=UPI002493D1D6|nr:hypothetical protein [Seonamhaeicola maritimus]
MKNKIFAVIGGTIALFGLGYLIYVILGFNMHNGAAAGATFTKLEIPSIILMEILYATLLTIVFSKLAQINTFSSGLQAGLIIGAFIGACGTLHLFATSELVELTGVISATITFGIRFAVAGGVIGWLLGRE